MKKIAFYLLVLSCLMLGCGKEAEVPAAAKETGFGSESSSAESGKDTEKSTEVEIKVEAPAYPYVGMSESLVNRTKLGPADEKTSTTSVIVGREHVSNEYKWYDEKGKLKCTVTAFDGEVSHVGEYYAYKWKEGVTKPTGTGKPMGDPYDVDDYDNAEDFWEDHEDEFEDYEDAEDYYDEAQDDY